MSTQTGKHKNLAVLFLLLFIVVIYYQYQGVEKKIAEIEQKYQFNHGKIKKQKVLIPTLPFGGHPEDINACFNSGVNIFDDIVPMETVDKSQE